MSAPLPTCTICDGRGYIPGTKANPSTGEPPHGGSRCWNCGGTGKAARVKWEDEAALGGEEK